ncbi:MAG: 50S ribosomal protein L1 [Nitrospirae bacterium]|nr:50S ribosomal protein L1 [Nitrospirota bacterium]MBI4838232.1 50S ribosomal protein L1 [Nitrospirota bacterium]
MGKKHSASKEKVESAKQYSLEEAVNMVKQLAHTKFDETVDLAMNLGVDPKKSDQMVRGTVVLPHGLGKKVRVIAFAKGEKAKEAADAGAEHVGAEDLVEKISGGWLDFDKVVATPDIMGVVSKLGKVLGPRGLMPNPKTGTVTFDIGRAVKDITAGKVDYKTEKAGVVHVSIGKVSFDSKKLIDNARTVLDAVMKAKPATSKGTYLKRLSVSSTMGVGVTVDVAKTTRA